MLQEGWYLNSDINRETILPYYFQYVFKKQSDWSFKTLIRSRYSSAQNLSLLFMPLRIKSQILNMIYKTLNHPAHMLLSSLISSHYPHCSLSSRNMSLLSVHFIISKLSLCLIFLSLECSIPHLLWWFPVHSLAQTELI